MLFRLLRKEMSSPREKYVFRRFKVSPGNNRTPTGMNNPLRFQLLRKCLFFRYNGKQRNEAGFLSRLTKKRKKKHLYLKKKKRNAGVVWKSIPAKKSTLYAFRLFEESILLSE